MTRSLRRWTLIPLIFALAVSAGPALGQSIEGLGGKFDPRGISEDGSVVVGSLIGNGSEQAARWTPGGSITTLVEASENVEWSIAYDVTPDGSVIVGQTRYEYAEGELRSRGWIWTEDQGLVYLPEPSLGEELYAYWATAVGKQGGNIIVVGTADGRVVRWVNGGPAQIVGEGGAYDVSQDGSVIVGDAHDEDKGRKVAVMWVNGARSVIEDASDERLAVSADGRFVVGHDRPSGSPARWAVGGGKEVLSTEWGGTALSVSSDGSVVVGHVYNNSTFRQGIFIWREADGLRLLRDVLEQDYGMDLSAWLAFDSTPSAFIAPDANVIVGRAYPESWLVQLCGIPVAWENTSGGIFSDATNWANEIVPGPLRSALFDAQGSYSVTIDSDVENNALEVRGGTDLTLGTGSSTYTLSGECRAPSAVVESAFLELEEGKIEAAHAVLLHQDEPVLKVSSGGHLVVDSDGDGTGCLIAEGASGSEALIAVAEGGKVESRACTYLGDAPDTAGRLVVDGGGMFTTDTLVVGSQGTSAVEVPQGHLTAGHLIMAGGADATATITVENVGTLHFKEAADVGVRGQAELRLTNVAIATGGDPGASAVSLLVLGRESGAQGQLFIEDHSLFQNSDAVVGLDGDGSIAIGSNGSAEIRRIWIGGHLEGTSGTGTVSVMGAGSKLEAQRIWVGRGEMGILGALDGGLIRAGQITLYGDGVTTTGTGGTIRAPILQVGGGQPAAPKQAALMAAHQDATGEQGVVTDTLLLVGEGAALEVDALLFGPGGVIGGPGTFPSALTNTGVVSPGDSAGAGRFAVAGAYTQAASGLLEIDLGGTGEGDYDVLQVTGQAVLGGTLRIKLTGGFIPQPGDAFEIVRAGSITGVFEIVELPEGIAGEVDYGEKTVTVAVSAVTPTSNEEPVEELPQAFTLDQNRPNPFGGSTTIHFTLPEPADVRLVVYDLLGREVARLVEGRLSGGFHEVRWDASGLPSGVYLYRLDAGSFSQTRRMVVAR